MFRFIVNKNIKRISSSYYIYSSRYYSINNIDKQYFNNIYIKKEKENKITIKTYQKNDDNNGENIINNKSINNLIFNNKNKTIEGIILDNGDKLYSSSIILHNSNINWLSLFLKENKFSVDEISLITSLPNETLQYLYLLKDKTDNLINLLRNIIGSENYIKKEYCWPDGVYNNNVVLNDVSQLNATRINKLYQVRCIKDIQNIIKYSNGKQIITRGTKHSMGGHSIVNNGNVIDMQYINHIEYKENTNLVNVGSGCLWSDLIYFLNKYAKAPKTLQSYCTFSIGGTLAVNGHGITNDNPISESVESFRLIKSNGDIINCSRDSNDKEARDLFKHAIGGYGLFGIIYDVVLRIDNNYRLSMDAITLPIKQFTSIYEPILNDSNTIMKIARINTTNFKTIDLFVFNKESNTPTVSDLHCKPKEMGPISSLIYKWAAIPLRETRFIIERNLGIALDWGKVTDRNEMLYESAIPLSKLYSPIIKMDDTFVLQEYFIPRKNFTSFIRKLGDIVINNINKESILTLLNTTIRFVNKDNDTALPYAIDDNGMYAFVLYYRLQRTQEADNLLCNYHKKITDITLSENGTFYLPYRHHYTKEQLQESYPNFNNFKDMKIKYDPNNIFSNLWWNKYGNNNTNNTIITKQDTSNIIKQSNNYSIPPVSISRNDSFVKLIKDSELRKQFKQVFLHDIFTITNPKRAWTLINSAIWKENHGEDKDIYSTLVQLISEDNTLINQVTGLFSQVKQLSDQKKELTREIVSVIARLGLKGQINSYCSVGDHGKLILPLRNALNMNGKSYIIHDENASEDNIPAVLERGALKGSDIGEYIPIDYSSIKSNGKDLQSISDNSCDLVTINQGLHHLPPQDIGNFLQTIHRILRPGGIFIVREHDLDKDNKLLPMLDCAHMVFNAFTGVSIQDEKNEIRGFRSVLEWREIIENYGFKDSFIYEIQPYDPTIDIMMTFIKQPELDTQYYNHIYNNPIKISNELKLNEPQLNQLVEQIPPLILNFGIQFVQTLIQRLPLFREWLEPRILSILPNVPGLEDNISNNLDNVIDPIVMMLERFTPLLTSAGPTNEKTSIIPDDLFLLIPALRLKAKKGGVLEAIIISYIDQFIEFGKSLTADISEIEIKGSVKAILKEDIDKEFNELFIILPELKDIKKVIQNIGLPNTISNMIISSPMIELENIKKWILARLDSNSWNEFTEASKLIKQEKLIPHLNLIEKENSPWNRLVKSILGSPTLKLSNSNNIILSTLGLGKFITLWQTAQNERKKRNLNNNNTSSYDVISESTKSKIEEILPIKYYNGTDNINNVLSIISAELIGESRFGLQNTTKENILEKVNEQLQSDGILNLNKIKIPFGILRSYSLSIQYREIPNTKEQYNNISKLLKILAKDSLIDGNARSQNGSLTWYKLPEWLQVEIAQLFANSMEHTPWYRFPFMETLKIYGDVLSEEFNIVSKKYGKQKALFNSGLIVDIVPMIVMGLLFTQMNILAFPIKKMIGSEYNTDSLVEQIILTAPSNINWNKYNDMITSYKEITPGLWVLLVKTFKPLTDFAITIAQDIPLVKIIEISNQNEIQVKVEILNNNQIDILKNIDGCKVNFNYTLPQIGNIKNNTQISLDVKIPYLLSIIRECKQHNIKIIQLYDFYG